MKKDLTRLLILTLILGMLMSGTMSAQAAKLSSKLYMYVGQTVQLGPKLGGVPVEKLEWSSSDEDVVTASAGELYGNAPGKAVVSASKGKKSANCAVVVLPREMSVELGQSVALPRLGSEKYFVEHKKIAGISKRGEITAKRAGTTRIGIAIGKQRITVKLTVLSSEVPDVEQSAAAELDCANETEQIVLVDYKSGSSATLSIHEKQSGVWKQLYSCDAYVGRNGIGKKKEGDGKTPTGTYNLTQPFGIQADPGANMPYTKVTKYHYWCGTSGSKYYNQLVDEREVDRRHKSSDEYLISYKGAYNYCLFIDYNANGTAGKGSCIFLHCKGKSKSTAGCIAVSEDVMKGIIQWARPGAKIVIR